VSAEVVAGKSMYRIELVYLYINAICGYKNLIMKQIMILTSMHSRSPLVQSLASQGAFPT
jgi:hypothetical protein